MTFNKFLPEKYDGSASYYIEKYIIPFLPKKYNIIEFTNSIYSYLNNPNNVRYVRKFGKYKLRGKLYSEEKLFTVCDNEPALWFYLECFEDTIKKFQEYHKEKKFPIAFGRNPIEVESFSGQFNYGKQKRENNFSQLGLKHCHILDCSPKTSSISDLSIDKRMIRLLSPMNHFPFPSPKFFMMQNANKNDWGEDSNFINLIKQSIHNKYYKNEEDKKRFNEFLSRAGASKSDMSFLNLKDFNISFSTKELQNNFTTSKRNQHSVKRKDFNFSNNIVQRKNFILKKSFYGKNYIIQFYDKLNNLIEYNHDLVLNQLNRRITDLDCWEKYGYYSNSRQLPRFVEGLDSVRYLNKY